MTSSKNKWQDTDMTKNERYWKNVGQAKMIKQIDIEEQTLVHEIPTDDAGQALSLARVQYLENQLRETCKAFNEKKDKLIKYMYKMKHNLEQIVKYGSPKEDDEDCQNLEVASQKFGSLESDLMEAFQVMDKVGLAMAALLPKLQRSDEE